MNIGVRAARRVDGTIIITAAWCPDCRDEVMPHDSGRCNRCRLLIVDERTLSAREMCKQINGASAELQANAKPDPPVGVHRLARLLVDAGDLLDAIAVAKVSR